MADRQRGSVRGCHLLCSNTSCGKPSLYFVLMDLQPSIYPHTHPSSLSPTPQPTHWASWRPPATAPQTLRESRPGQPGQSLQGALINQTSLPCGHSPATGSRPPSAGSLEAHRPVPQGDPSTCSPPRGSRTRPAAPLSAPAPGLDTDLCRGHTGPSGWQPFPSCTEK